MQRDILACLAQGLSDKEIARRMDMSIFNVDYHMRRLRSHFGVRNRVQLAAAAALLRPAAPLPQATPPPRLPRPLVMRRRPSSPIIAPRRAGGLKAPGNCLPSPPIPRPWPSA